ncbi:MAG: hypothetical protein NTW82_07075 [Bacteroidia bacterium]|nr:hypothetical protein [Bacteroidia bacterium]
MKKLLFVLATAILISEFIIGQNVVDKQSVTGSWFGRISAGAADENLKAIEKALRSGGNNADWINQLKF